MLSSLLCLLLVANNRYLINLSLLMVASVVIHANLSLNLVHNTKLLFNSYSSFDQLSSSIIVISGLIIIWLISLYGELILSYKLTLNNEFIALILLLGISLSGLIITNSYLNLFVAIELQSLTLYILFATNIVPTLNNNVSKVSLSYLINAAMATALLLFGIAINSASLILMAIIWKLGVVPVHVWSLPILDNQHSLITSIYLTIAKYGTLLIIAVVAASSSISIEMLTYVGLLNLTIGNVLGLLQFRYQRIIVYSSLIQIGYMLLILSLQTSLSLGYFELYSFYTVILLILWIVPTYNGWMSGRLFSSVNLWIMVLTLYTVAGLPFFPLFWTKLDVLLLIQNQSLIIALLSTLLSSLIYVRLIKYMAFFQYN